MKTVTIFAVLALSLVAGCTSGYAESPENITSTHHIISSEGGSPMPAQNSGGEPGFAGSDATPSPAVAASSACQYSTLIGEYLDDIDQESLFGNKVVRVLRPDSMVTEDYSPDRVNIVVDENNIITSVHCG